VYEFLLTGSLSSMTE